MRLLALSVIIAALVLSICAAPAMAQGKGKGKKKHKADKRHSDYVEWYDDRWEDRWDDRRERGKKGGPPFCRNGRGHPVHGWEWCERKGYGSGVYNGRYDDYRRDRRYDRRDRGYDRRDRRYDSYERAHSDFHYRHDRECRLRAAERPLNIEWQLRVRSQCKARHDDWHYRAGRRHDGSVMARW